MRYLIVDDEAPSRANLRLALAAHPDWQLAAECDSAAAARAALAEHEVDVIFLDIQMPLESGLVLAREISRLRVPPLIVFATAYSEHAVDAFEVHALDYLLKPLSDGAWRRPSSASAPCWGSASAKRMAPRCATMSMRAPARPSSGRRHQRALGRPHRADPRGRHPVDRIGG